MQPGGFAAGNAYLTGRAGEEKKDGEAPASPALDEIEKEIAERRK